MLRFGSFPRGASARAAGAIAAAPAVASVPAAAMFAPASTRAFATTAVAAALTVRSDITALTSNQSVIDFVNEAVALCKPDSVHICDGSAEEATALAEELVSEGRLHKLNPEKRPNCYLARSDPLDVARSERRTFICTTDPEDTGYPNNHAYPDKMWETLEPLFEGSMQGRRMLVIPYTMGPWDSPMSRIGIEITDSRYVALGMGVMARMGSRALATLGDDGEFVKCLHSVGKPWLTGEEVAKWSCDPAHLYVTHFPEQHAIYSFGSQYGGNALLGKKAFALRIASYLGKQEGWLAEHMLILKVTPPGGESKYVAAAFPSACGKTNFAMMTPTIPGWKVECVGDDIAWMRWDENGQLRAINPENGFFGVAPGTSEDTNPMGLACTKKDTIFTNVAMTKDGDVWWDGLTKEMPEGLTDWYGDDFDAKRHEKGARPDQANSRFCSPLVNCPSLDHEGANRPDGVPIDAIIFGGRRRDTVPLVYQAFDWEHGVFVGATMSSQQTSAAEAAVGKLMPDPFAMRPFCGYNMADYFSHWLSFDNGKNKMPPIFHVNWFREPTADGPGAGKKFIWPGFGDNARVLDWILKRVDGADVADESPVGYVPKEGAINIDNCDISPEELDSIRTVSPADFANEVDVVEAEFKKFGARFPEELNKQAAALRSRIESAL